MPIISMGSPSAGEPRSRAVKSGRIPFRSVVMTGSGAGSSAAPADPRRRGSVERWFGTTPTSRGTRAGRADRLLLDEVNHRPRTCSDGPGVGRRTARGSDPAFLDGSRLAASLALNQDVLVKRAWGSVPLRELAEVQLSFVERRRASSASTVLTCAPARAAEMIGWRFTSCTNALKYGALSVDGGHVQHRWSVEEGASRCGDRKRRTAGGFNGPAGFGSTLIRDVPRLNLGGSGFGSCARRCVEDALRLRRGVQAHRNRLVYDTARCRRCLRHCFATTRAIRLL